MKVVKMSVPSESEGSNVGIELVASAWSSSAEISTDDL